MKKRTIAMLLTAAIAGTITTIICKKNSQKADDSVVPEFVFTYAENQASDYPTAKGAYRFAKLVKERTNGRIEILVKTEALQGEERSVIEQMQFGGVDFARVSLSPLCNYVPKLNVLQLPYLYDDADHMWEVLEGEIGDDFLNSFEGTNLVALSWYEAGARNFYTSMRPIRKPEDIKNMKIRVQESELMTRMIEILGGVAVPTPYSQVYSALERKTIDGAENNWPSYESEEHYKVAKYYTIDEHARVPEVQLVSESTWNKLSKEDQDIIRQCAQESSRYERQLWNEREQKSREHVIASGCEVVELSSAEKTAFRRAVQPVYEEFCADFADIIKAINEAGQR